VIRKARAVWYRTGRGGKGELCSDSGVLANTPFSFSTRFESEKGTNPEELIAAAHAGCFTMALATAAAHSNWATLTNIWTSSRFAIVVILPFLEITFRSFPSNQSRRVATQCARIAV
jgi:OsmC subfamily peroxiredoxin